MKLKTINLIYLFELSGMKNEQLNDLFLYIFLQQLRLEHYYYYVLIDFCRGLKSFVLRFHIGNKTYFLLNVFILNFTVFSKQYLSNLDLLCGVW